MALDCTCNRLKEAEEKAAKWDAIVRCGECVHVLKNGFCDLNEHWTDPDGFCDCGSKGES